MLSHRVIVRVPTFVLGLCIVLGGTAKDLNHGNKMVYSAINEVESTLGVYTCTTAAC